MSLYISVRSLAEVGLEVVVLAVRVGDVVLCGVERAKLGGSGLDERVIACAVRRELPEHGPGESVVVDILRLELDDIGSIVRDKLLLGRVIRVGRDVGGILEDLSAVD